MRDLVNVLIETYWNVNKVYVESFSGECEGLNRNILECKSGQDERFKTSIQVLIETYWNVNYSVIVTKLIQKSVLIETYWNVNMGQRWD